MDSSFGVTVLFKDVFEVVLFRRKFISDCFLFKLALHLPRCTRSILSFRVLPRWQLFSHGRWRRRPLGGIHESRFASIGRTVLPEVGISPDK